MTLTSRDRREITIGPRDVKEIVVPLDGSDLAARALPLADLLADLAQIPVVRVTVVPPAEDVTSGETTVVPGVGVTTTLEGEDTPDAIAAYVSAGPGRLLCMSTHGRGRVGAGLLGSVAESVLRRIDGPALLVGPDTEPELKELRRVVACVDGSKLSEAILPVASRWADDLDLRLDLVQVVTDQSGEAAAAIASGDVMESSYVRALARWLRAEGVSPEWEVLHGRDPVGPILDYARAVPETVVALATHGRSGWSRVAMGSVAMRLAHESPVPLLVYRPPALDEESQP
jgi:nucleotide-binding universal stress UspA family protein